eukprot:364498-Chlamydomonas_euryale.AAC.2
MASSSAARFSACCAPRACASAARAAASSCACRKCAAGCGGGVQRGVGRSVKECGDRGGGRSSAEG